MGTGLPVVSWGEDAKGAVSDSGVRRSSSPRSSGRKVVMVTLPSPWLISDRDMPNLGVLYIAAYLREHGVEVAVSDLCGVPEEYWQIAEGDIYGISLTTPQFHLARAVAERLRARQPECTIVMGGYHPTAMPDFTLENTAADYVVVGDGEETMLAMARGVFPEERVVRPPMIEDIRRMPWPARDLIDIYQYQKIGTNAVVGAGATREEYLITSRGCPFKCGFCAQMAISGFKVRYRDEEDVVAEMRHLLERYKVNRFYMFDDIFIIDRKQVFRLCDAFEGLLAEHDFDWHCLARTDVFHPDIFPRMFEVGCRQVTFGIEHASDTILKRIEKHTTRAENERSIRAAKEAGMRVRAQMIVGLPGETRETVEEVATFMKESSADSFGVHIFVPLPGSPIWNDPERFDFAFNRQTTFKHYQTIGKPGEWAAHHIHKNADEILEWAAYPREVAGSRNVATFDARWMEKSQAGNALYRGEPFQCNPELLP